MKSSSTQAAKLPELSEMAGTNTSVVALELAANASACSGTQTRIEDDHAKINHTATSGSKCAAACQDRSFAGISNQPCTGGTTHASSCATVKNGGGATPIASALARTLSTASWNRPWNTYHRALSRT